MSIKRRNEAYRHCLSWAMAAALCGAAAASWAQTGGSDTGAGLPPSGVASPEATSLAPPVAASPWPPATDPSASPAAALPRVAQASNIEDGIRTTFSSPDVLTGPNPGTDVLTGAQPADIRSYNLAANQVVTLFHAKVVDTAQLEAVDTSVSLFGIEGFAGEPARQLQDFLAADGDQVACEPQGAGGFVCLTPAGTDVAQMALVNGAARTSAEAPDSYRAQELAAQAARRGIWANLPPPPDMLTHPTVRDTATLLADGRTYVLDGIIGLDGVYASQLQGYIAANGDTLTCSPQGAPGHYVCLLSDGTDIAMVALVNGAARVAPEAPDTYRLQQTEAINNRRGYWLSVAEPIRTAALAPPPEPPSYSYVPASGDDGADGVRYVGGAPVAVIDSAPVFLAFTAGLGWGYYDRSHHWRPAPERYRAHMERFHPEGRGLRGYGGYGDGYGGGMPPRDGAPRPPIGPRPMGFGPAGFGPPRHAGPPEPWNRQGPSGGPPGFRPGLPGGWVHTVAPRSVPGFHHGAPGFGFPPGPVGPAVAGRPGADFRPGMAGPAGPGHPGLPGPGFGGPAGMEHPGMPGHGFRPGPSGPASVPRPDVAGPGFRPGFGGLAGMEHPGGPGFGFHPGPSGPASAPRPDVAGPGFRPGFGGPVGMEHPGGPGFGFRPGPSGPASAPRPDVAGPGLRPGVSGPPAFASHPTPIGPMGAGFRTGMTTPAAGNHGGPFGPPSGGFGGMPERRGGGLPMPGGRPGGSPAGDGGGFMHAGAGGGFRPSGPPSAMHAGPPPVMHAASPIPRGGPSLEHRRMDDNHRR